MHGHCEDYRGTSLCSLNSYFIESGIASAAEIGVSTECPVGQEFLNLLAVQCHCRQRIAVL